MLKTTMVAMTLLGCDCDAKQCEYISDAPGQWTSVAECEVAMKRQVLSNSALDYPLVTGMCRTVGPQTTLASVPVSEDPALPVVAAPEEPQTMTSLVFQRTSMGYQSVLSGMDQARSAVFDRGLAAAQAVTPMFSRVAGLLPSF